MCADDSFIYAFIVVCLTPDFEIGANLNLIELVTLFDRGKLETD
jgi:hypothetical protein